MTVSARSVSKRPVGWGNPESSSSITSTCNHGPSNSEIVRSQLIRTPSRSASPPPLRGPASARECGGKRSAPPPPRAGGRRGRRPSPCCLRRTRRPGGRSRGAHPRRCHARTRPRLRPPRRHEPGYRLVWKGGRPRPRIPRRSPPRRRSASRSTTRWLLIMRTPSVVSRSISALNMSRGIRYAGMP